MLDTAAQYPDLQRRLAPRQPDGRRPQLMSHRWEELLFLHWPLERERIQRTLPQGLTVDTFEGKGFVGVIPFFMRKVRPTGMPPLPGLSDFHELNVRTYVYDKDGIPGIWFYSLSCDQPLALVGARLSTGLNYVNADMTAQRRDWVDYTCRRRGSSAIARYRYRGIGESQEADSRSLEYFLLERYYLYAVRFGSLLRAQVHHHPYLYSEVELESWSAIPAQLDGFLELLGPPSHACYVEALDVNIYGTQKLARACK